VQTETNAPPLQRCAGWKQKHTSKLTRERVAPIALGRQKSFIAFLPTAFGSGKNFTIKIKGCREERGRLAVIFLLGLCRNSE